MMDSILNIGVNDSVIQRLVEQSVDPRFAYDVQKRFLQMFGTVVRQVPKEEFLKIVNEEKAHDGVVKDSELSVKSLQNIIHEFKKLVDVPDDPFEQLKVAIESIFGSWMGLRSDFVHSMPTYHLRAKKYRELHHISDDLGTAVVIQVFHSSRSSHSMQSMVFGNFSTDSCVGKICTRNPDNGINNIYGKFN
jgi:pyruvate, orthophosphate dikinase